MISSFASLTTSGVRPSRTCFPVGVACEGLGKTAGAPLQLKKQHRKDIFEACEKLLKLPCSNSNWSWGRECSRLLQAVTCWGSWWWLCETLRSSSACTSKVSHKSSCSSWHFPGICCSRNVIGKYHLVKVSWKNWAEQIWKMGSALLIFLDFFNAYPSLSLPHAGNWVFHSLLTPCWECFLAQRSPKHLNFMNKILMSVRNDPFNISVGSRNRIVEGGWFSVG